MFPSAPTEPRAVVLRAHPNPESFNTALADAWSEGARELTVTTFDVDALDFDLRHRPHDAVDLEPDLVRVREAIERAAHVVVAAPLWWSSVPANLKGLFDRAFLSGWAFAYGDNGLPTGGLKGRSARVLMTMDAPVWYDTLVNFGSARRQLAQGTLRFCGMKTKVSAFGGIHTSNADQRAKMLERAQRAGRVDAARVLKRFGNRRTVPLIATDGA